MSPRIIFVQNAYLLGLFSGELIFGGAYYWREFCVSKWVALDDRNSLKQLTLTVHGLMFGRAYYWKDTDFRLRFGGLIFGRAYFLRGL